MAIAADAVKSKPNKQLQTENFLSSGCSERLSRLLRVREYTFLRSGFARFSVDGVATRRETKMEAIPKFRRQHQPHDNHLSLITTFTMASLRSAFHHVHRLNIRRAAGSTQLSSMFGGNNKQRILSPLTTTFRYFTPMTAKEEEQEQDRVADLTPFQKDQELRKHNREIATLEMLKGINTGELYTWTGKYKALARDYGFPLVAWYWAVWGTTCVVCYTAIHVGGVDAMALLEQIDMRTGFDLVSKVDPSVGKIGLAVIVNELVEPVRLPVVIMTVKPVMDQFFPPKY
jgi:hypothetical protein